jgi:hypothetical protein
LGSATDRPPLSFVERRLRVRSRLVLVWNLESAARVAWAFLTIACSASTSVHVSPWIGAPLGVGLLAAGGWTLRRLDSAVARRMLRDATVPDLLRANSVLEATEVLSRAYWGDPGMVRVLKALRAAMNSLIVALFVTAHAHAICIVAMR